LRRSQLVTEGGAQGADAERVLCQEAQRDRDRAVAREARAVSRRERHRAERREPEAERDPMRIVAEERALAEDRDVAEAAAWHLAPAHDRRGQPRCAVLEEV